MPYPSLLPIPTREAYQGTWFSPKRRTKMDDGSTRGRRKNLSNPRVFTYTWKLTWSQRALFDGWMKFENANGQNFVDLPAAGVPGTVLAKCLDGNPSCTPEPGGNWTVSARFLTRSPIIVAQPLTELPVWPSILPDYESDGYNITKIDPNAASSVSRYATPQTRQRFKSINIEYSVSIICTATQREAFIDFYYNTLLDGTGWFATRFVNSVDNGLTRVRITDHPTEEPIGAIYGIKFILETSEARTMTRAEYDALTLVDQPDDNDYALNYFEEDYAE